MLIKTSLGAGVIALTLLRAGTAASQSLEFGPPYTLTGSFQNPFGVAVNRTQGHLLVSDTQNRQIRWTSLSSVSGTPVFQSFAYIADPAQPRALVDPQGIAADGNGHVYVVDARRNQLNLYTWNAATSTYELDINFASATRNAVDGTSIESPRDVAVDASGKVYLLDSGRKRVLRADGPADTTWEVFISDSTLSNPYGIDVGPDGRVYVADTDHHQIVRYEVDGSSRRFGRFGTGAGEFRSPRDVVVDIEGRMYVADTNNHRVVLLDTNGQDIFSLGRAPTFGFIQKLALDERRRLYIVDSDRNSIIAFLGRDTPAPFDGWIRDYVGDTGAQPSDPAFVLASPDILVRHDADVDVSEALNNGLESIVFEQPRFDQDNYVYIAVRNRGSQELRDAVAKVYWADPSGALRFPVDWKETGFFTGSVPNSAGNALIIPPIAAGGVTILGPLRFRPPAPESSGSRDGTFVIGVRIVHPFDVALAGSGPTSVRASNNVAIRKIQVFRGPFPTGDQNTLVVSVRYADDPTPIDGTLLRARIAELQRWITDVSWTTAAVRPLFRGDITLPQTRAYYRDPSRNLLIEMASDALKILLQVEPDLLGGQTPRNEDIGRVILVTNDATPDVDWATTGPWPYQTVSGDKFLTVSVQAMNNSMAAFAHGLGHQLSLVDLFAYPNVIFPRPFADGWDNMAQPFNGVNPTVWSKQRAGWNIAHRANIIFIPRPGRGGTYTTGAQPIPLYRQVPAKPGENVAIAIGLTPGVGTFTDETVFYYLEARSKADPQESSLPGSGVLMYYVNNRIPQGQGPIIIRDHGTSTPTIEDAALQVGDSETPAGTGLTVKVGAGSIGGPDYLIDISYTPPETGYDVYINTGQPGWMSPDIWIDNKSNGYDVDSGRTPADRGDKAIGGEENRIYARIHNAGPAEAFDVEVAFFISEPFHTVGGEADFTFLKSEIIPRLPPGETTIFTTWSPSVRDVHSCVQVVVRRVFDDINTTNNAAQKNLEVKWSTTASPFTPVDVSFQYTNPEPNPKLVYFRADDVPLGWSKQLNPDKAYLAPNQTLFATLHLLPPPTAANCTQHNVFITAWAPTSHTLVQLGGTTANVNLAKQSNLAMSTQTRACREREYEGAVANKANICAGITVKGCTSPVQANTEVVLRYEDALGNPVYRTVQTDANGCFEDFYVSTQDGDYTIAATIDANLCFAPSTATRTVRVGVPNDPADSRTLIRVIPAHYQLRGAVRNRVVRNERCNDCRRASFQQDFTLALTDIHGGPTGKLHVPSLMTSMTEALPQGGVHTGSAQLLLSDGSVIEGEVHGIMKASKHGNQDRGSVRYGLQGQFTGLVLKGSKQGYRLVVQYSLVFDTDNVVQGAVEGLGDSVWLCNCDVEMPGKRPEPIETPNGCIYSVAASATGGVSFAELHSECGDRSNVLSMSGPTDARLVAGKTVSDLAARYFFGELTMKNMGHTFSSNELSVAWHRGEFEIRSVSGERIRGNLGGLSHVDPARTAVKVVGGPHHLEGTLQGTVVSGPLKDCTLYGHYSIDYPVGDKLLKTQFDWSIDGAIVCDCEL